MIRKLNRPGWAMMLAFLMVADMRGAEMKTPGDRMMADYFARETRAMTASSPVDSGSGAEWSAGSAVRRRELAEMLGLWPEPERTPLNPVITSTEVSSDIEVRKLHFESMPGLYVTGNLYLPLEIEGSVPAVIYVCGHGQVKMDGVAYGNKVYYQHHPTWFARHGYACLALDTIQLGELEGIHHGTYRENMWWWNSRGYTPAGVEAWNGIRAIDYLQSLKEIDPDKIGITGRSGGGAYSWWIAALDERIKAAAPVAGITDLQNHVVDGVIEGHCDCMFHVNTYRWDFDQVAALIAPRPLLILNTDSDPIFPLDGVYRLFMRTRKVYESLGHPDHIGLVITPGGHKDTQELQLPAFKWMNLHLKGVEEDISPISDKPFSPQQLQVFREGHPTDQRTTTIHESFSLPRMKADSPHSTADLQTRLREKCFAGWPATPPDLQPKTAFDAVARGIRFQGFDFSPQPGIELRIYSLQSASLDQATSARLSIPSPDSWIGLMQLLKPDFGNLLGTELADLNESIASPQLDLDRLRNSQVQYFYFLPRGLGRSALSQNPRHLTHTRRRFMLLGQTLAGMQTWDILQAARTCQEISSQPVQLNASGDQSLMALLAGLMSPAGLIRNLTMDALPDKDQLLPDILNLTLVASPSQILHWMPESIQVTIRPQ